MADKKIFEAARLSLKITGFEPVRRQDVGQRTEMARIAIPHRRSRGENGIVCHSAERRQCQWYRLPSWEGIICLCEWHSLPFCEMAPIAILPNADNANGIDCHHRKA